MKSNEIKLIRDCLSTVRTKYYYYKDRYALQLLAWKLGDEQKQLSKLKANKNTSRFLNKPSVKEVISNSANGTLNAAQLNAFWPDYARCYVFRLTLAQWGEENRFNDSWFQTSRSGFNLVLQMNFPAAHDRDYRQNIKLDSDYDPFAYTDHPVKADDQYTLAWSRLDIELDDGIALIEEIQTDWLREAKLMHTAIRNDIDNRSITVSSKWQNTTVSKFLSYYACHILPLEKIWDEAMLSASLWFLKEELGITKVYFHTWESGLHFKGLEDDFGPPRSIYTKLPRRFGFEQVEEGPSFIVLATNKSRRSKKQKPRPQTKPKWWLCELN